MSTLSKFVFIAIISSVLPLAVAALFSATASAQDKIPEKNPLGFRSDFGLELSIGGHSCVSGGGNEGTLQCSGNNKGWDFGSGWVIAGRVRPVKFFSAGLELSYMGLRPGDGTATENGYKRFFDFSVGPVFKFHIPIRIRVILMDISLGIKTAFVNGFLYEYPNKEVQGNIDESSKYYRHRLFGPEISGSIGLDLYVVPRLGFGVEVRPIGTLYQSVCFDKGSDHICRGVKEDSETQHHYIAPFKLFYGLHIIYYL